MARVDLAPAVLDDFDRFFDPLAQFDVAEAPARIARIMQALQILSSSPLIGRPVRAGQRELVIGHGARGYVALYRHVPDLDLVLVLALRTQREAGYKHST